MPCDSTGGDGQVKLGRAITSKEAWIVALLAMAVAEASGRALVQALRHHLLHAAPPVLAQTA